jgi:hypothetical protein
MPIISTFFGIIIECTLEIIILPIFMLNFRVRRRRSLSTVGSVLGIFLPGLPGSWCGTGLVVTDSNS